MSKRMTDTEKWKKKFIRGLDSPYKLLWLYLMDDCNHAGIWEVDIEVARIRTGVVFDENIALEKFRGKILSFDQGEKWFIPDFIEFQYGVLKESNRVHISVIEILQKYNLMDYLQNKPLISPLQGVKDKAKDKDKDKAKAKEEIPPFSEFKDYAVEKCLEIKLDLDHQKLKLKYDAWKESDWQTGGKKPHKIINWKSTLNNSLIFLKKEGSAESVKKSNYEQVIEANANRSWNQ